ncbi:MAG: hypothetical protein K2G89_07260 [Lachnospiraceae bacterium]|nr:hypothetical protein [Lachnospiraceae bacterium]
MKLTKGKRLLLTLILGMFAVGFTGCSEAVRTNVTFTSENTAEYKFTQGVDQATLAILAEMEGKTVDEMKQEYAQMGYEVTDEMIDNTTYFMISMSGSGTLSEVETAFAENMGYEKVCLNQKMFYAYYNVESATMSGAGKAMTSAEMAELCRLAGADDMDGMNMNIRQEFSVTFAAPVVKTNGSVDPANPNCVTWVYTDAQKSKAFYAMTAAADGTAKVTSVKNKKNYKKNVTIKVAKAGSLAKLTLDGKAVKPGKVVKTNGQHELICWSLDGKVQKLKFVIDKKKPIIYGAKNGKTYKRAVTLSFEDLHSGIASVTVNGKKISAKKYEGYTVKKNGTYKVVIKDKAGNQRSITFKIKR